MRSQPLGRVIIVIFYKFCEIFRFFFYKIKKKLYSFNFEASLSSSITFADLLSKIEDLLALFGNFLFFLNISKKKSGDLATPYSFGITSSR